jgi:hypothetical protein
MISMVMSLDIRGDEGRRVRLFFPVILVWLVAFALLIAVLPLVLIAALATAAAYPGLRLLRVYPAFFRIVFATAGLMIDVGDRGNRKVYIALN